MEVERVSELVGPIGGVLQGARPVDGGNPVPRVTLDTNGYVRGLGVGGRGSLVEGGSDVAESRPVGVRGDLDDRPVVVVEGREAEPASLGQPVDRQELCVLVGRVQEAELRGR